MCMDKQFSSIFELLKSIPHEEFGKTVDLHVHSTYSDGKLTPEELLDDAKKKGLKYFAICDHNTVDAYTQTPIWMEKRIIPAIEFDCWFHGVLVHILGYGIDVKNENLQKLCAKTKKETEADIIRFFNRRRPKDVIKAIHDAGGAAVLAHPACYWCFSLDFFVKSLVKLGLDGVEAFYPYKRHRGIIKFHFASTVKKVGEKYGLILTGGSDSHGEISFE